MSNNVVIPVGKIYLGLGRRNIFMSSDYAYASGEFPYFPPNNTLCSLYLAHKIFQKHFIPSKKITALIVMHIQTINIEFLNFGLTIDFLHVKY